jgi:NitT/TauT family transport system permease protein
VPALWRRLVAALPIPLVVAAWEVASRAGFLSPALVPAPSDVLRALGELLAGGELLLHAGRSLGRAACGIVLSVLAGTALGVGMARLPTLERFAGPLITLTFPLPKSALIPVLMIWLGIGDVSKIAVIVLGTLLPVVVSAYNGVRGVDPFVEWSARNCGTVGLRLTWKIIVPAALPDILSGVRMALALAFVLLVSSELLVARDGLGHLISLLGEGGQYPGMFAVAFVVGGLGFAADRLYLAWMRRVLRWRAEA